MRVRKSLDICNEELQGQEVDLLICEENDLGVSVIVNNRYDGMIFDSNIIASIEPGDERKGYVEKVRDDGKLDIRLEPITYEKYDLAESKILELLQDNGKLMLSDKSPSELINKELGMSKRTFKQAIGKLYKHRRIKINKDSVELLVKT
jgi:predicted RNA-binding protein (virulence factor B family)